MSPTEKLQSESRGIGGPGYVNPNCWLAESLNAPPLRRCWYCEMKFSGCPFFRYLIITLFLIPLSLLITFLIEREISEAVILSLFFFLVSYAYLFNKSTEELIVANFSLKKAKKALEESKSTLEIKVNTRTKELKKLAQSLEKQVSERTKELQGRVNELERFHKLTVRRELKMVELKKEIKRLKGELGEREK